MRQHRGFCFAVYMDICFITYSNINLTYLFEFSLLHFRNFVSPAFSQTIHTMS